MASVTAAQALSRVKTVREHPPAPKLLVLPPESVTVINILDGAVLLLALC